MRTRLPPPLGVSMRLLVLFRLPKSRWTKELITKLLPLTLTTCTGPWTRMATRPLGEDVRESVL